MSIAALTPFDDEPVVLAAATRVLAAHSALDAVPALLDLLRTATGAASVELESGAGCLAVGTPLSAVGGHPGVPVVRAGAIVGVLRVSGGRPRPRLVEAVADLLAVALVADPALGAAVLAEAEADLEVVAGRLHDGPAQDAVASRYAATLLGRGVVSPDDVSEAVDGISRGLRAAVSDLRSRGADGDLVGALRALADRHPDITLTLPDGLPALAPATATLGYRILQAALALGGRASVVPGSDGSLIVVVAGLPDGLAHEVRHRFLARCAALGAQVDPEPVSLRLRLPAVGTLRKDTA